MDSPSHFIIIAGEASGDHHAAHLVGALKQLQPSLTFSGLGGARMAAAGVELYRDMAGLGVTGVWEALKNYRNFRRLFNQTLAEIKKRRPRAVILVDYPGFNLRLAKKIKALDIKVIYYISPKVWAWKENRVKQIRKYVDRMLVIFEFEVDYYKKRGIDVEYVGHPMVDQIQVTAPREQLLESVGLADDRLTIGLLPGSRLNEIERHLPLMIETARLLAGQFLRLQFIILQATTLEDEWFRAFTKNCHLSFRIVKGDYYNALNACDVCLVASGTATLETAFLEKPMVMLYKTSWLTYQIVRLLIRIKHASLVNIIARKEVIPECLQYDTAPEHLSEVLRNMLVNEIRLADMKTELRKIKDQLGGPGASLRAARAVLAG
jgi:lipid-A-disaccharide synthase